MAKDPTNFRNRFKLYKEGKMPYENGLPKYEDGRPDAIKRVDNSDADFAKRLKLNWRLEIWDWEGSGKAVTHKMGDADNIVYPNVQTTAGGGLIDFTNPIWQGVVNPLERAIKTGDYVPMKSELDARWFGPNYKKYYPGFKCGKLPRYFEGTDPYEEVVDFLRQHEGYRDKVYLDGNGIPTIGYGFTDSRFVNKGTISRTEADAELKRQIKTRQSTLRDILGADKWDSLTDDSRKALTSYHYNYPAGFKSNTKFMKAWRAGNYAEAIRQIDAGMNDPKNPGLRTRRLAEQALLKADPFLTGRHEVPMQPIVAQPVSTAVRPTITEQYTVPAYDTQVSPYISGKPMLHLMPAVSQPNLILMVEDSLWKPSFKNGKSPIHIKPANRGKFTALKKRTGHSASWFKENGTPAQKKMAVFALNAKKWHHADGKLPKYGNGTDALLQLAKGGVSIIPGAGTLIDGWDFYNDPSLENLGYLALSGIGDAAIFTGIGAPFGFSLKAIKSAAKLNKTRKTLNAVMSANKAGNAVLVYDAKKAYDASKAATRALAAETGNLVDTTKSTYEAYTK